GILEAADDFFQFHLQEVSFSRQKGAVASVISDRPLETVYRVVSKNLVELGESRIRRVADLDVFAAVGNASGQIVLHPLVAELHAAAHALFIPIAILAREVRSA